MRVWYGEWRRAQLYQCWRYDQVPSSFRLNALDDILLGQIHDHDYWLALTDIKVPPCGLQLVPATWLRVCLAAPPHNAWVNRWLQRQLLDALTCRMVREHSVWVDAKVDLCDLFYLPSVLPRLPRLAKHMMGLHRQKCSACFNLRWWHTCITTCVDDDLDWWITQMWQHSRPTMPRLRQTHTQAGVPAQNTGLVALDWHQLQRFDRWCQVWQRWLHWMHRSTSLTKDRSWRTAQQRTPNLWVHIFLRVFELPSDMSRTWTMRWSCASQVDRQLTWVCSHRTWLCAHQNCAIARRLRTENEQVLAQLPAHLLPDCQFIILAYLWTGSRITLHGGRICVGG
jgi:hypothetical protein